MHSDLRITTLLSNTVVVGEVLLVTRRLIPCLCCVIEPVRELLIHIVVLHDLFKAGAGIAQQQGVVDQFLGRVIVTPVYTIGLIDHLVGDCTGEVEEMIPTRAWELKSWIESAEQQHDSISDLNDVSTNTAKQFPPEAIVSVETVQSNLC